MMGYRAPRRAHIVEDVAAQRRERTIAVALLVCLVSAVCVVLAIVEVLR
jgi:hypothetical protein